LERIAYGIGAGKNKWNHSSATYSVADWATFCLVSKKKLKEILKFLEEKEKFFLKYEQNRGVEMLTIDCPNILKHRDNYADRRAREEGQKSRTLSEQKQDVSISISRSSSKKIKIESVEDIHPKDFEMNSIFNHWVSTAPERHTAILDNQRRNSILKMLEHFTTEQMKQAIDGCMLSPFHNGEKTGEIWDNLELIFRDVSQVERFINIAKNPPNPSIEEKKDNSKYDTLLSENNDDKVVKFVEILKRAEMQCRYNLNVEEIKMYYDELKTFCLRSISFAFSKFQTNRTPYDGKFPKVSLLLDFARIKQNKFEEDCARIWEEVLRYIERKWKLSDLKEGSTEHLIFNNEEFRVQFPENLEELLEDSSHRDYSKRDLYKKKFIDLYLKIEGS
jgi:hypothetical protein